MRTRNAGQAALSPFPMRGLCAGDVFRDLSAVKKAEKGTPAAGDFDGAAVASSRSTMQTTAADRHPARLRLDALDGGIAGGATSSTITTRRAGLLKPSMRRAVPCAFRLRHKACSSGAPASIRGQALAGPRCIRWVRAIVSPRRSASCHALPAAQDMRAGEASTRRGVVVRSPHSSRWCRRKRA